MGDRVANIESAITELTKDGAIKLVVRSAYYLTSPVDYSHQPDFVNNMIEIRTKLSAKEVLNKIKEIESAVNDARKIEKGPRVVDLDIIIYDKHQIKSDSLIIPHKAICKRRFVLVPLIEISPYEFCVHHHCAYQECLTNLVDPTQKVELYHD